MRKFNEILLTKESRWLASTTYLLDLSEYLLEAYEADTIYIRNYPLTLEEYRDIPFPEVVVPTDISDEEELRIALELIDKEFLRPKITFIPKRESTAFNAMDYMYLYDKAVEVFYVLSYKILRPLITPSSNEYLLAVLENAKTIVLEGNRNNVKIPLTRKFKTRFMAHTHPRGLCIPSHKDIESVTRLLMDGGFGEIIMSPACSLAIYRKGMFVDEDYERMIVLARRLSKTKDMIEALRIMNNVRRELKSVRIVNI